MTKKNLTIVTLFFTAFALAAYLTKPVTAQTNPQFAGMGALYRSSFATEQVSVTSSATVLSSSKYNPTVTNAAGTTTRAEFAQIECDSHNVRVWMSGDVPTSTVGLLFNTGTIYTIQGYHDIVNFQAISADGSTAACNVQYYRFGSNTP